MLKYLIGNLRKKPLAFRQNVAFWCAFSFTAVVVAVWAYHLPARHQSFSVTESDSDEPSGFSGIIDIISDEFTDMQASVAESEAQSSTSIRAEQSLQRAVDQARLNAEAGATSSAMIGQSGTSTATSTATSTPGNQATSSAPVATEPRPVRIVTTSPSSTAPSTE